MSSDKYYIQVYLNDVGLRNVKEMSVLRDYCTLHRSSRSCLFDQNPRSRRFMPRFVEPERRTEMCRLQGGLLDCTRLPVSRILSTLIDNRFSRNRFDCGEWVWGRGEEGIELGQGFVYLHRAKCIAFTSSPWWPRAYSRRRVFRSTASITFTSIQ